MNNYKIVYKGLVVENTQPFGEDYFCEVSKWLETDWMSLERANNILNLYYKEGVATVLFAHTKDYSLGDVLEILEEPKLVEKEIND